MILDAATSKHDIEFFQAVLLHGILTTTCNNEGHHHFSFTEWNVIPVPLQNNFCYNSDVPVSSFYIVYQICGAIFTAVVGKRRLLLAPLYIQTEEWEKEQRRSKRKTIINEDREKTVKRSKKKDDYTHQRLHLHQ